MGCSGSNTRKDKFNICVAVDGSEISEYGLQTFVNRHKPNEKLNIIHVSNENKKHEIPEDMQVGNYFQKLKKNLDQGKTIKEEEYELIHKEKSITEKSTIEIVHETALEKNCDLLVVGSSGHQGEKKLKTLTKGVEYLVKNCKIPTLVMNETEIESNKNEKGKNWLVAIKNESYRSFRSLEFCFNIIDKKKDTVIGLHLKNDKWPIIRIKKNFDRICAKNGLKNYEFVKQEIDNNKSLSKNLLDHLFFSQYDFDFVVLNNNIRGFKHDCFVVEMLKNGKHNILYCRENI